MGRALRVCGYPGCPELVVSGRCTKHALPQQQNRWANAGSYIDPAWRAIRARYITAHPYCEQPGCGAPTYAVDHIVQRIRGGSDDDTNLQGLCEHHHNAKSGREGHSPQ